MFILKRPFDKALTCLSPREQATIGPGRATLNA